MDEKKQKDLSDFFYQEGQRILNAGLPITYQEGTLIIKEFPNGIKEIIGEAPAKIHFDKKIIILR